MKALDDIQTLLSAMQDRGAEMRTFEGLLGEISAALADILGLMEKPAAERAENDHLARLVAALTDMRPPEVKVNVQPSDWKALSIDIAPVGFDGSKRMTVTKLR